MPEEDSKEQLKKIATWIWANDENNDFGYLDYMRIGAFWLIKILHIIMNV